MIRRSRTNVSRQKAMARTRRKPRAIAGTKSNGLPKPRVSDTGGGMRPPKVKRPKPRISDTGGGMRPRRKTDPRRARAIAQQRNTRRGRR
mgnify:FL=1